MSVTSLGFSAVVPGNSTRYFESAEEAKQQRSGAVDVAWDKANPYLFNAKFNSDLIQHDSSYCTTVKDLNGCESLPTADYFLSQVGPHVSAEARVVEIGCGQGEFIRYLSSLSFDAIGFDPALRHESDNLCRRYWTAEEVPAELYVMRCVLPHIENPWRFLEEIRRVSPESLVLIEFQRTEWVIDHSIWYMLNHDHVNYFFVDDFSSRYNVRNQGFFKDGEWAWVLVDFSGLTSHHVTPPVTPPLSRSGS